MVFTPMHAEPSPQARLTSLSSQEDNECALYIVHTYACRANFPDLTHITGTMEEQLHYLINDQEDAVLAAELPQALEV